MLKKKKWGYTLASLVSVVTVLVAWYICINVLHLKAETVFPGPITVAKTFFQKLYTKAPDGATLLVHLASSLKVALLGYALGVVFGVPVGIMMAWNKWVDRFVRPLFDLIRPVPGLAWIPMFILLFGIGIMPKAAVIFLSTAVACIRPGTNLSSPCSRSSWSSGVVMPSPTIRFVPPPTSATKTGRPCAGWPSSGTEQMSISPAVRRW